MYTVYATAVDPKRGGLGTIVPLAIGFILDANILAGWPFDGSLDETGKSFRACIGWLGGGGGTIGCTGSARSQVLDLLD